MLVLNKKEEKEKPIPTPSEQKAPVNQEGEFLFDQFPHALDHGPIPIIKIIWSASFPAARASGIPSKEKEKVLLSIQKSTLHGKQLCLKREKKGNKNRDKLEKEPDLLL